MEGRYNLRSPAVKRLMREALELSDPTSQYYAQPLEDNLFEWHFTVQGPADSDFESGRYHGRIILPPEYPMKPPSIMLLTPNGRFETGKKICLSMSAHHPETWQPSWSIRTVLLAIIGFMPSNGGGAIGALDYTSEERRILARNSKKWNCSVCGSCNANSLKEEDSADKREANKKEMKEALQISFKSEKIKTTLRSMSQVDDPAKIGKEEKWTSRQNSEGIVSEQDEGTFKGTEALNSTEIENHTETVNNPEPVDCTETKNHVRKRSRRGGTGSQSREQQADIASSLAQSTVTPRTNGYVSLILILTLTVCLVVLILRRIYNQRKFVT